MDGTMKAMYTTKVNYYYNFDKTQYNKFYLMKKYNVINRIKWNIMQKKKQYVLLNLLCKFLLYETIWKIISILLVLFSLQNI